MALQLASDTEVDDGQTIVLFWKMQLESLLVSHLQHAVGYD